MAATQTTAQPTSTGSPSSEPSATPTKAKPVVGAKALKACQRRVRAADDVLAAAKIGVRHWAIHVQAQTDGNSQKISPKTMSALFKQTRLAGPSDQQRYRDALDAYEDLDGSCNKVKGAPAKVADKLSDCRDRAQAQKPVWPLPPTAWPTGKPTWRRCSATPKTTSAMLRVSGSGPGAPLPRTSRPIRRPLRISTRRSADRRVCLTPSVG